MKSSRYKYVSWHRRANKWHAYYIKDGVVYHIGYFKDEDLAAEAVKQKGIELNRSVVP